MRTDRRTDMTNPIVAFFFSFAEVYQKESVTVFVGISGDA